MQFGLIISKALALTAGVERRKRKRMTKGMGNAEDKGAVKAVGRRKGNNTTLGKTCVSYVSL